MPGKVYGLWKWRAWTTTEDDRIRRGGTAVSIAAELGRTLGAVLQRRRKLGLAAPARHTRVKGELARLVLRYWHRGWTDSRIASRLNVCPRVVTTCRYRLGLEATYGRMP